MSDLLLAQMDDFFIESMCFDTSTEGNGDSRVASPIIYEGRPSLHSLRSSFAPRTCGMGLGWGKAKGRSPVNGRRGSSDPMIEAGAPSTGVLQVLIGMVCASHRG